MRCGQKEVVASVEVHGGHDLFRGTVPERFKLLAATLRTQWLQIRRFAQASKLPSTRPVRSSCLEWVSVGGLGLE